MFQPTTSCCSCADRPTYFSALGKSMYREQQATFWGLYPSQVKFTHSSRPHNINRDCLSFTLPQHTYLYRSIFLPSPSPYSSNLQYSASANIQRRNNNQPANNWREHFRCFLSFRREVQMPMSNSYLQDKESGLTWWPSHKLLIPSVIQRILSSKGVHVLSPKTLKMLCYTARGN